jgi:hypothetical protein
MFRPIWPSSDVNSYIKIALKTAALFHLCFPASHFRSIVHWYVRCFLVIFVLLVSCTVILLPGPLNRRPIELQNISRHDNVTSGIKPKYLGLQPTKLVH